MQSDFEKAGSFIQISQGKFYENMKKLLIIPCLFLISFPAMSQKVSMKVIQSRNPVLTAWQIIDSQNTTVFIGKESLQTDSVTFGLEANRYYFLKVSLSEIVKPDTILLTLILNGEPIMLIRSDIGRGEHILPFFTGVRQVSARITGGTSAPISDFPWQVYYISGNFRCGGSIISNRWVITAAHCTKNSTGGAIPVSSMSVKVGADNPSDPLQGKVYDVASVIVNEGFDNQTLLNDIALLSLKDTINFANATPIKLINSDDVADHATVPGVLSWVTGWGLTHVSPDILPSTLQKVQLPIISNEQASTVWTSIPATDLMAGYLNGNKDACNGDSGGPLVVPVLGEYKLAGIVSWGSVNCNTYGAYTRVSDFEDWIRTNTGIAKLYKPPVPSGDSIICQGTESSQYSVPAIAGASLYEWKILPSAAGVISGNGQNSSVIWNISYTGPVTVVLRVTINSIVSDWSGLKANVVLNTRLLSHTPDTTICANQPITLIMNAEGYNLGYKWFRNDQVVQSGTSEKLVFSSATTDDTGEYSCEISGSCGLIESDVLNLTVYPVTSITNLSSNAEITFGSDLTLNVTAEGHDLVYQWMKDGNVIDNSNTASLLLPALNANGTGIYKTTVTGTCGVVTSDSVYIYVKRPGISSEPDVFVWPTVTSDEINVALSSEAEYNIQIFNTMGKIVRILPHCRYQTRINIGNLAKDVYVVRVYNNFFRKSIKIIKQ